jgi:hypothetical protein
MNRDEWREPVLTALNRYMLGADKHGNVREIVQWDHGKWQDSGGNHFAPVKVMPMPLPPKELLP